MNFEDLQKSWQGQPVDTLSSNHESKIVLENTWQKHQRTVFRRNVMMTICFAFVCIGLAWVYLECYKQYGLPFLVSILCMYILLAVYIFIVWWGYGFTEENTTETSAKFIDYQLKKLAWQRNLITTYIWVYTVLLWLSLVMYTWEVTARGTATFRIMAIAIITIYIFVFTLYSRYIKQKKGLKELDQIIYDLKHIRNNLP